MVLVCSEDIILLILIEIYLPSLQQSKVFVMEESGKKKREIITEKTDDGIPLLPFGAITFAYRPIYFNNGKMYIPKPSNMRLGNKSDGKISCLTSWLIRLKMCSVLFQLSFLLLCLRMMLLNHP